MDNSNSCKFYLSKKGRTCRLMTACLFLLNSSINVIVQPDAAFLGKAFPGPFKQESRFFRQPLGRKVVWPDVEFDPMESEVVHEKFGGGRYSFLSVSSARILVVDVIAHHAPIIVEPENRDEFNLADIRSVGLPENPEDD